MLNNAVMYAVKVLISRKRYKIGLLVFLLQDR